MTRTKPCTMQSVRTSGGSVAILRCGHCGGGMSAHGNRGGVRRIRCSAKPESGACANDCIYRLDLIERSVADALVDRLGKPDAACAWLAAVQSDQRDDSRRQAKAEKVLAKAIAKPSACRSC